MKKQSALMRMSFKWRGRRNGVSRWWGARNGPPAFLAWPVLIYGVLAGVGALAVLLPLPLAMPSPARWALATAGLIHCLVFGLIGLWSLSMRKTMARLQSVEEMQERLGLDANAIRRLAAQKGVRPRLNMNDEDLFEPDELIDSASLLRGSAAPISPDTLVRPASPIENAAEPDRLLRAALPERKSEVNPITGAPVPAPENQPQSLRQ